MDDDLSDLLNDLNFDDKKPQKSSAKDTSSSTKPLETSQKPPLKASMNKAKEDEDSDFDSSDIAQTLGNIDSMDDILFGKKKPANQTNSSQLSTSPVVTKKPIGKEANDPLDLWSDEEEKKPMKSSLKKSSISEPTDSIADTKYSPSIGQMEMRRPPTSSGSSGAKAKPRADDADDDLMDSLGLGSPRREKPKVEDVKVGVKSVPKGEEPRAGGAKSILDELLGKDTTSRHLERPGTGERRDFSFAIGSSKLADDKSKDDDEPLFDSYTPSSVTSRPTSRRSVRFEGDSERPPTGAGKQGAGRATSDFMNDVNKEDNDWLELALGSKPKTVVTSERPHSEGRVNEKPINKKDDKTAPSDWLGLSRLGSPNVTPREETPSRKGIKAELNSKDDMDWLGETFGNEKKEKSAPASAATKEIDFSFDKKKPDMLQAKNASQSAVESRFIGKTSEKSLFDDEDDWQKPEQKKTANYVDLDLDNKKKPAEVKNAELTAPKSEVIDWLEPKVPRQRRRSKDDNELGSKIKNETWDILATPTTQEQTVKIPTEDAHIVDTGSSLDDVLAAARQRRSQQKPDTTLNTYPDHNIFGNTSSSSPAYQWSPDIGNLSVQQTGRHEQPSFPQKQQNVMSSNRNFTPSNQLANDRFLATNGSAMLDRGLVLLDTTKRQHDEDVKYIQLLEEGFQKQLKIVEESAEKREKRLREENDILNAHNLQLIKQLDEERVGNTLARTKYREEWEEEKLKENERIRKMFREEIDQLYEEHARSLERLRQAKEREVNVVSNSFTHSKTLQDAATRLDDSALKLKELENLVTSDHDNIRDERKQAEVLRNKQIQELQERLIEMDREQVRLQSQVVTLQTQLVEQTREVEQARSNIRLEEGRLRAMQESIQSERMAVIKQVQLERSENDKAKALLMEEQKEILAQLHSERRQLAEERAHFMVSQQLKADQEKRDQIKNTRLESEVEGSLKALREEKGRIATERLELQRQRQETEADMMKMEEEKLRLKAEREKLDKAMWQLRQKTRELEEAAEEVARTKEEGERLQIESKSKENIYIQQSELVRRDVEQLRSRERSIIEEKAALAHERQSFEELKSKQLCINCKKPMSSLALAPPQPYMNQTYTNQTYSPFMSGIGYMQDMSDISAAIQVDRSIRMYKLAAQRDKAFLNDERFFLQTIQQSPRT